MIYNPLLKDLEKWQNKDHLYETRYFWWFEWSRYAGIELNQELLKEDEFRTPTTTIDFITGEPLHEISIFSFSENLGLQVEKEFKELHIGIQSKHLEFEKESQKKIFLTLIVEQLEKIGNQVKELNLEDIYKNVLIKEFQKGQGYIKKLLPKEIVNSDAKWYFKYTCTNKEEGNQNLNSLTSDLVKYKLIEASEENIRNVKKFFKEGKLNDKVIWAGSKSDLVTFFRELVKRDFIETTNHWIAVDNCFTILHKSVQYSTKGLKSEKGTQSKKRKEELFSIIDLLEI